MDWQVGDLAVCVNTDDLFDGNNIVCTGGRRLTLGAVYRVRRVATDPDDGATVLDVGVIRGADTRRFRKIRPDEREACEPEFVTLLKRSKVPEPAHGYDDFLRGGVPGVEGRLQTRLGTWVRVGKVKGKGAK